MVGSRASEKVETLFLTHLSLFSDKEDDDGIFPRNFPGKDPEGVKKMFNTFFETNIIYDLTRQWILSDGPFSYDYSWLSTSEPQTEIIKFAKDSFARLYGVNPDLFELVTSRLTR